MTASRVAEHREQGIAAQIGFVVVLAVAGTAAAVHWGDALAGLGAFNYLTAGGFAVGFFVLRLLSLKLPQGDEVPVTVMAGMCALGLLGASEALAAALAVGLLDAAARSAQSSGLRSVRRALDAIRGTAVLAMIVPAQALLRAVTLSGSANDTLLVAAVLVGLAYALIDVVTVAIQERLSGGASVPQGVRMLLRPLASVYLVHIAMGAVVLRVYPTIGMWGFGIAVLMTLILQNSFNLYLRIRRAYGDTIEALAHAAELDRPQDAGHAQRVTDLAIAVGRQMELSSHELEHLRYAALLHDLGRIGHPDDGGDEGAHARRGADIVAQIPFLEPVSPLILGHHEAEDEAAPVGAHIIGVCSRYDRLRMSAGSAIALATLRAEEAGPRAAVVRELDHVLTLNAGGLG